MKKIATLGVIAMFLTPVASISYADPIYILVGQSVAAADEEDEHVLANKVENAINLALQNTGINSREVIVNAHPIPVAYLLDATLPIDNTELANDFMRLRVDPIFTAARDTMIPFYNEGYDLQFLYIDTSYPSGMTAINCGRAEVLRDFDDDQASENFAFASFEYHAICQSVAEQNVIAHEFGHLLGGEHQVSGGLPPDTDLDNPVPYNHPMEHFSGSELTEFTVMSNSDQPFDIDDYHHQFSRFGPMLGNTGLPAGALNEKDMFQVIINDTWNDVAEYRPKPLTVEQDDEGFFIFWQLSCLGGYEWVPSLNLALPGVHLSYRRPSNPLICWTILVEGSTRTITLEDPP